MRYSCFTSCLLLTVTVSALGWASRVTAESPAGVGKTWSQWRGADQNGVATGSSYPTEWSEDQGIAWKIAVPGSGGSTPVVDETTAYLTSGSEDQNWLRAYNLTDGTLKWEVALGKDRGGKHAKGSGSNPSPVIDGDAIYAYYRSGDLACVGADGKVRWQTNLQEKYGEDSLWWDLGSSPTLTENAVVIAVMQTGPSYLVAYDKQSGSEIWKTDRILDAPEEAAQSYSTPLAVTVDGKSAIAVMGADHLTIHDAASGRELGILGGFNPAGEKYFRSISSPVALGDVIVCPYARGGTLTAVDMKKLVAGKGKESIVWFRDDLGSDVPTPAAKDGRVYVVGDGNQAKGTISCLDIQTGKTIWSVQLTKSRIGFSSSPLLAGDQLYVTQEDATTHVIGPLSVPQPDVLSVNTIGDSEQFTVASLIPVEDSLLLRSRRHLYRIK